MHRADRGPRALYSSDQMDPVLQTESDAVPPELPQGSRPVRLSLGLRVVALIFPALLVLALIGYVVARHYIHTAMREALPQLDGILVVPAAAPPLFGLGAPVTVARDTHGVPHIHASSVDDLVYAQGFITAQDRLWQMELLRRHAAGELASILGPSLLEHDRLQRTLQIRAAADRAITVLPADQKHLLDVYARGVNASILQQHGHLPLEFRVLQFSPGAWSARDSLLIALVMYQDLSTSFPTKLEHEALATHLPEELVRDLYPVGSWRDHYPGQPVPDLTAIQPEFEEIPLDESQSRLRVPARPTHSSVPIPALLSLQQTLAIFNHPCSGCAPGSNGWAVAGSRTASGKPLVSNDMHLTLTVPGLWYEADLRADATATAPAFHAAGLSIPGAPLIVAGHNNHVAWGFTNLGADVQDLYIEHTRGTPAGAEYQASDGSWKPMQYRREVIHVRGSADVTLDVPIVQHGADRSSELPVISSIFPGEQRTISLRWSVYDPLNVNDPFFAVDSASDWTSMLAAFSNFGGPAQNLMYADDQGHIGYHAVGRIPIRGDDAHPSPLAPTPTDTEAPDAAAHEWSGYIPFDQLPQAFDPPDGVLATANGKVIPDNYPWPITLDWMAPYRTERIYKLLESTPGQPTQPRRNLTPKDMLAVQTDVFSELDVILAHKLSYAIDHASAPLGKDKALRQAADILRGWKGQVTADSAAAAIVNATRNAFWPMLLVPHLAPDLAPQMQRSTVLRKNASPDQVQAANLAALYLWGERFSVEEQLLMHQPARWLPTGYKDWNDFLATVAQVGLRESHAPGDLKKWSLGKAFPLVLDHGIYSQYPILERLIGRPTGPGIRPQNGDGTTVDQVGRSFEPSERLTVDLSNLDNSTLNLVLGESGNVSSPWYMDQFEAWLHGRTFEFPYSDAAVAPTIVHTLTLQPRSAN